MDSDSAIELIADVLQLIEASFPELSPEEREENGITSKDYSSRTGLWKIHLNLNKYFRDSFNDHSKQQRKAKNRGNDGQVSFHSKTKTKECRYALPIDAL